MWWENTPHETHRPIYMAPTLINPQMPKSNRTGRKVQIRRLNYSYKCAPAVKQILLGVPDQTVVQLTETIINAGPWADPHFQEAIEIDGISEIPIPWRLTLINK